MKLTNILIILFAIVFLLPAHRTQARSSCEIRLDPEIDKREEKINREIIKKNKIVQCNIYTSEIDSRGLAHKKFAGYIRFNHKGQIVEKLLLSPQIEISRVLYEYSAAGNIVKKHEDNSNREYIYDSSNNLVEENGYYSGSLAYTYLYTYTDSGGLLQKTSKRGDEKSVLETYEYNKQGKILKEFSYYEGGKKIDAVYEYNREGKLENRIEYGRNGAVRERQVYRYPHEGRRRAVTLFQAYSPSTYSVTEYSPYGNIIKEYFAERNGSINASVLYFYDSRDNFIKTKLYKFKKKSGLLPLEEYVFNKKNILEAVIFFNFRTRKPEIKQEYEYLTESKTPWKKSRKGIKYLVINKGRGFLPKKNDTVRYYLTGYSNSGDIANAGSSFKLKSAVLVRRNRNSVLSQINIPLRKGMVVYLKLPGKNRYKQLIVSGVLFSKKREKELGKVFYKKSEKELTRLSKKIFTALKRKEFLPFLRCLPSENDVIAFQTRMRKDLCATGSRRGYVKLSGNYPMEMMRKQYDLSMREMEKRFHAFQKKVASRKGIKWSDIKYHKSVMRDIEPGDFKKDIMDAEVYLIFSHKNKLYTIEIDNCLRFNGVWKAGSSPRWRGEYREGDL
ncbi:MAG: DUF2963 domain-containing protein [bacterium]|nr:DUF2963 domain-containing protein [bacterium]